MLVLFLPYSPDKSPQQGLPQQLTREDMKYSVAAPREEAERTYCCGAVEEKVRLLPVLCLARWKMGRTSLWRGWGTWRLRVENWKQLTYLLTYISISGGKNNAFYGGVVISSALFTASRILFCRDPKKNNNNAKKKKVPNNKKLLGRPRHVFPCAWWCESWGL